MRKSAYALALCLLLIPTTYAQQNAADAPASKADVQRFLDAMHSRDMLTKMMAAVKNQQRQMIHEQLEKQKNLPPDFEAKMDDMMDSIFDNMPIDDFLQVMVPVYQKHFTKGDMDAFVAFYSSPTGQKLVRELPAVTAESMQASQGIVQKMMAQVMQRVQDQIAQVQKQNDGSSKNK
jgi:uncharacterized protein